MSSVDHTEVVIEAVSMRMILVVADVVAGKPKPAGNAEAGVRGSVAAVSFDADIAIREIRISDSPDIDDVGPGPERLNDVWTDQIRVTKSNRLGRVVVAGAGRSQYVCCRVG